MAKKQTPALIEIDKWFETTVLPHRTAAAGFSKNRVYKSPLGLIRGNVDDPNGLCGDVSTYVAHLFDSTFRDLSTTDGFQIGMILWDGVVLNHIANIMLPTAKAAFQSYSTVGGVTTHRVKAKPAYEIKPADFLKLRVYDLYYKLKPTTVKAWWEYLDSDMAGTVRIGLEHDFT